MILWAKHTCVDHLPLDSYLRKKEGERQTAYLTFYISGFLYYSNFVYPLTNSVATIKDVLKIIQSLCAMLKSGVLSCRRVCVPHPFSTRCAPGTMSPAQQGTAQMESLPSQCFYSSCGVEAWEETKA